MKSNENNSKCKNNEINTLILIRNIYHSSNIMRLIENDIDKGKKQSHQKKLNRSPLSRENYPRCSGCLNNLSTYSPRDISESNKSTYRELKSKISKYEFRNKSPIYFDRIHHPSSDLTAQDFMHKRLLFISKLKYEIGTTSLKEHAHRSIRFSSKDHFFEFDAKSYSLKDLDRDFRFSTIREDSSEKYHLADNELESLTEEDLINHILIQYTSQKIDQTCAAREYNYSGSYMPDVGAPNLMYYVGGFGQIDGITECARFNKAAAKYKNIELNADEKNNALSHMYGMSKLLGEDDSNTTDNIPDKAPVPQIFSNSDTKRSISETFEDVTN